MIEHKKQTFVNTLRSGYKKEEYIRFLREMLNNVEIKAPDKEIIPYNTFSAAVEYYTHIGYYTGSDKKRVALFSVCLKDDNKVENARGMQRSFVKSLLQGSKCEGALVAFFTKGDMAKWRLSLVRLDYEFSGGRLSEKLTPAKRYSYLVGDKEPCHTAQERLFPIFANDDENPSLDTLEEAFSVEAVTKDFFDRYREKYLDLKEYLESNPQFVKEAEERGFDSEQFAKKLMGQIVFLYFIQKKGWLGVNAFPAVLTEKEYRKAFYRSGSKPKELMNIAYKPGSDGDYHRDNDAILKLSDDDETFLSTLVKGDPWGTGPKDFMNTIFEGCIKKGQNFFDDYLEPLFYTGLNKNRGENAFYPLFHRRIPFLNGGLFEEMDGYDWQNNDFSIPNELFSNKANKGRDADGILDVFNRYNFTMAEDEPMEREVAIDPEMLGKVFENLLDVKDRKSKGAFYTPREIVHYMCQESLINYLAGKTGISEDDIRTFVLYGEYFKDKDTEKTIDAVSKSGKRIKVFDKDKEMEIPESILSFKNNVNRLAEIDGLLAKVKVVDPAVGSGAFPLGMLNEIVKVRNIITSYMMIELNGAQRLLLHSERNPYRMKRETIRDCIFACDIEPSAVDITKLRLWLSLVIDNQIMGEENEELGYSTKPRELPNLDCNIICGNSLLDEFMGHKLMTENDALKNVSEGYQGTFDDQKFFRIINELIDLQTRLYDEKDHTEKDSLKQQIQDKYDSIVLEQIGQNQQLADAYYQASQQPSRPFVLWQLYFPKVFRDNGGFDIVIGNPPYGALFSDNEKRVLDRVFENSDVPDYESADFFIELGRRVICDSGILSYIIPNMFMSNVFAKKYRHHLLRTWLIKEIDNLSEIDVFESASVRNCIVFLNVVLEITKTLFSKKTIGNNSIISLKSKELSKQELINDIDNWLNMIDKDETVLCITAKMVQNSTLLKDIAEISQGLIPYDKYRGHTPEMIKNKIWNASYKVDETYKMELRGKDVNRYSLNWNGKDWLSYGTWLAAPRKPEFFTSERILIREITNPRILATYSNEEYYNTPSIINCINFSVDIYYVLGIVNSKLMSFYHNMTSPKASKGLFPKILVNDVRKIPIKTNDSDIMAKISELVKRMLNDPLDRETDKKIDGLVYELYEMSDSEIEYIEKWYEQKNCN